MTTLTHKDLLDAGVHFGHMTRKWHPNMAPYIFMERNGVHIIDLNKTLAHLKEAAQVLKSIAYAGKKILFVATKKQAKDAIEQEAKRLTMPYVTERWLGGTLTNFATIRKLLKKMASFEKLMKDTAYRNMAKKEQLMIAREKTKLERLLKGIGDVTRIPAALLVVDIKKEHIAVQEAQKLGIPVFALADTNVNPLLVDYPIPSNDDASRSIALIIETLGSAIEEGLQERKKDRETEAKAQGSEDKKSTRERNVQKVVVAEELDKQAKRPGTDAKVEIPNKVALAKPSASKRDTVKRPAANAPTTEIPMPKATPSQAQQAAARADGKVVAKSETSQAVIDPKATTTDKVTKTDTKEIAPSISKVTKEKKATLPSPEATKKKEIAKAKIGTDIETKDSKAPKKEGETKAKAKTSTKAIVPSGPKDTKKKETNEIKKEADTKAPKKEGKAKAKAGASAEAIAPPNPKEATKERKPKTKPGTDTETLAPPSADATKKEKTVNAKVESNAKAAASLGPKDAKKEGAAKTKAGTNTKAIKKEGTTEAKTRTGTKAKARDTKKIAEAVKITDDA